MSRYKKSNVTTIALMTGVGISLVAFLIGLVGVIAQVKMLLVVALVSFYYGLFVSAVAGIIELIWRRR